MEHGVSSIGGCNLSCMTRAHLIYGNGKMREDGGRDADVYMEAILFANVFDSIRTAVCSGRNRKRPSKILRSPRVNIMLKQSETLNILPIAQDSVFVHQAVPLPSISPHPLAFLPDTYFSCSNNATNVAKTWHIPASKKLGQIDLKRQNSPLDDKLSYRFVGLILQRKQLTRDSLLSLFYRTKEDQLFRDSQLFKEAQLFKISLYLYSAIFRWISKRRLEKIRENHLSINLNL